MLSLETVKDFSELLQREPEWSRFIASFPDVTPFQLPMWLLTWWRHFGSGELSVYIFRSGDEIVAVVPCFRHEWDGKQQITLIGSGISDYLEPGIVREHSGAVLQMLAQHLREGHEWDVCAWQDLNADTPLQSLPLGYDLAIAVGPEIECTETQIPGNFEHWWEQRPHGLRRNVRRYLEKAKSIAEPEFCVFSKAEPELVHALISLHGARWGAHGEPGMIAANNSGRFLHEIFDRFACADLLRFFALRFNKKLVAVICSFPYRRKLFSYLSAFDPEYEIYGFGRLLLYYSMRYAFENQYVAWSFLRGSEPYKFDWGARSIPKCRLIVTRTA